ARTSSSVNSIGADCLRGDCFEAVLFFAIGHHTYISTIDILPSTDSSLKSTKFAPPLAVAARISKLVVFERRSHLRQPRPSTQAQALSFSLIAYTAVIVVPRCHPVVRLLFLWSCFVAVLLR